MNQEKFKKASEKIIDIVRLEEQGCDVKHIIGDVAECYGKLLLKYARELVAAADENETQNSETACKCCDKNGEGFARATLRTTAIKRIEFSEDGAAAIRMRNGDPIIFKDISEVMFIS